VVRRATRKIMKYKLLPWFISLSTGIFFTSMSANLALPPPSDIPEEILRTEIILEGRSPMDGQPMTAAEYAELQAKLAESPYPPQLNPKLRQLIFLLQVRKFLKTIIPLPLPF
jgi:hypothetical protein